MAEISQKDQLALHEFSVRYRAALAEQHQTPEQSLDTVRDAVRDQYEQEMDASRSPGIEGPAIEGPTIGAPEHDAPEPEP